MKRYLIIYLMLTQSLFYTYSQNVGLSGTLLNSKGKPLSGAKIELLNKTGRTAFTNITGVFEIDADAGDTALVQTSAGFRKTVVLHPNQAIVLGSQSMPIDIGYGAIKSNAHSTMAASVVSAHDLEKSSAQITASNALYGQLLGLNVLERNGFADGKYASLNMRGMGKPLVLVDGFIRNFDDLNIEEIESITLLKDGAAAAIYGFDSSNGVIHITTKRGKYNSFEVGFSYEHNINFANELTDMVDAYTFASGINEALANDGIGPRYNGYQLQAFKNADQPQVYPNVNWGKEALRDLSHSNSYNFNVKGGGKNIRYFSAVGYDTDNGFVGVGAPDPSIPNQFKYSNLNVRTNLDINLTKNTLLKVNLLGKLNENTSPLLGSAKLMEAVYNTPAVAFPVKTENDEWGSSTTWKTNPVADLKNAGFFKYHTRSLWADFTVDQKLDVITKGLRARASLAYDSDSRIYETKFRNYRTEIISTPFDEEGKPQDVIYKQDGENQAVYDYNDRLQGQMQRATLKALVDYQKKIGKTELTTGYIHQLTHLQSNGTQKTYNRLNHSLFVSYNYNNRFLLDGSITAAASNVLNPQRKWGYFPAVSGAWIISNENMLRDSKVFDFLKLRASWSITGNDNVGFDAYQQGYTSGSTLRFGNFLGVPTLKLKSLPVHNLTYNKNTGINIGLEAKLLGHVDFTFELFSNRFTDLLTSTNNLNSSVLGLNPPYANNGERTFKGVETAISYSKITGNFKYAFGGKFTYNKSEIVNMNEQLWKNDFNKATGQAVGQIFGLEAIGFFKDLADIEASDVHTFTQVQPGDIKYKDQDNNGIIDEYDRVPIGYSSTTPEIYYSFDAHVQYKNIGVNLMFQGVGNYSSVVNNLNSFKPLVGNNNMSQHYYRNRWIPGQNDNSGALYPRLTTETNENNFRSSTLWLQDRSYLKLRTAEIYYNLPKQLLNKAGINRAKIFARAYNLFSIHKMDVSDPESLGFKYPLYRTFNFGIKLGL